MSYIFNNKIGSFILKLLNFNTQLFVYKYLENTPGVQGIELEKRLPCERMLISSWEQRHLCSLPEDLRQFYSSTDGFRLIWNYEYAGSLKITQNTSCVDCTLYW